MNDAVRRLLQWLRAAPRHMLYVGGGALVLVVVLAAALRRGHANGWHHVTATVRKGDLRDVVEATGTVNAVVTVQVGAEVSGRIAALRADFNSRVHRGDTIALIEPSALQASLLQASADLENARANVPSSVANLSRARAMAEQADSQYAREQQLFQHGNDTQEALELARANAAAADAAVQIADAGVAQARAQVTQKQAAVSVAQTNLDHTIIRSPIDGIVVSRNVDAGQTVAASLQAPTLFTIAQDLRRMQVYAAIDESDVGRITPHARVSFKVDAFPGDSFSGVVSQFRMNPTTVQNVVTYNAIVDFDNPQLKLFPGMTAYLTIPVAAAHDVVMVPNAALRYRSPLPPDEVRALYRQYAIPEARGRGTTASDTAVVWKLLRDGSVEPVRVALGITDHAFTAVTAFLVGRLAEGDEVVTRSTSERTSNPVGGR